MVLKLQRGSKYRGDSQGLKASVVQRLRHAIARRERALRRQTLALAQRLFRKRPRQVGRRLQRQLHRFQH
jgi:hypothetical protein